MKVDDIDLQRIITAATNGLSGITLNDKEMNYVERLDYADRMVQSHPSLSDKGITNMIMEKYQCDFRTAQKALNDAKVFHSPQYKVNKIYQRMKWSNLFFDYVERIQRAVNAAQKGDPRIILDAAKVIGFLAKVDAEINGLNKDESDVVNPDDLKQHVYRFTTNPKSLPNMTDEEIKKIDEALPRIIQNKLRKEDLFLIETKKTEDGAE